MMKVQHAGRNARLDMIPPLQMGQFRMHYEGGSGDLHRVRLSRHQRGPVFEHTLEGILGSQSSLQA